MIRDLVPKREVEEAMDMVHRALLGRLQEKGWGAYAGTHETFGVLHEEYQEASDAMHANDAEQFMKELIDVAVVGIFGLASMRTLRARQ